MSDDDGEGSCSPSGGDVTSLAIASIFIILAASILEIKIGLLLPLIEKLCPKLKVNPFLLLLGKTMGTGVVISVALIHLLLPANEAFSSPCLPEEWHNYEAFAYVFCCIGIFAMHATDVLIGLSFEAEPAPRSLEMKKTNPIDIDSNNNNGDGNGNDSEAIRKRKENGCKHLEHHMLVEANVDQLDDSIDDKHDENCELEKSDEGGDVEDQRNSHGHGHGILLSVKSKDESRIQAYMMEVAMSVHSVLIGLALGTSNAPTPLVIALAFHQFFEGIALGSRLAEAAGLAFCEVVFLGLIFAISAPFGIMIGVILIETINVNGADFLLAQGILDGVCSGILLYVGFGMLYLDFAGDMSSLKSGKHMSTKSKKILLFIFLWGGFGVMAGIGAFL